MNSEDLISLNEQIAGMARAGLPLDQGLRGLARDMNYGRLRSVTQALANDLAAGLTLPQALEARKGSIPPYYANLVLAGVQTGRLPDVLATLTNYARIVATTRTTVIDALLYPVIVVLVACTLFGMMFYGVIPQFDKIFSDFGLQLPWLTRVVVSAARLPLLVTLVPFACIFGAIVVAWLVFRATPGGRRKWARMVYLLPLVGTIIRGARLAAYAELLGMLVEYEVPLPTAFRLAGGAASDPLMAAQSLEVAESLEHGTPIAEAFRGRGLVPEWVAWMTGAGERRGDLANALKQVASVYRRQVESRSALLRSLLPPFIVITTAGIITAVFVIALMLPMVKLLEGLSK